MGCLSEKNIYERVDSLPCYRHANARDTHQHWQTNTPFTCVYSDNTHAHVHIAQIYKNVQSKQTHRGLTANDWSDPSLLLGKKRNVQLQTRTCKYTQVMYNQFSSLLETLTCVCVCVYVAQFSASFQEYHIRQEDVIL